jgi:hypothetical protein
VNRLQLGDGLALAWGLAAMVASCAQVGERGKPQDTASEAGQASSGASSSSAGVGGTGGSGLALGGSAPFDDPGGSTSVAGAGPVAVPLLDTTLCENDFVRVDQVPDIAPFFSGTFDGKPVDVSDSADVADPPVFHVFRFGATHVEAIGFRLYLAEGPYSAAFQVSAVDCGISGDLRLHQEEGFRYYELASSELLTVTHSVDGFSGLTTGSVSATWINDDGEQHVLEANFALNAVMGDASTQR